jgi:hypothetical protein
MLSLHEDCPRCSVKKITFDVVATRVLGSGGASRMQYEVMAACRSCSKSTLFIVENRYANSDPLNGLYGYDDTVINDSYDIVSFVNIANLAVVPPPDHVPQDVAEVFREGATCHNVRCYNAAGAMFRLVLDLATKNLLPAPSLAGGPSSAQRKKLFDRLEWLFDQQLLPGSLRGLADCVRQDGNDAAHDGSLAKADSEDLLDFSLVLLERVYTEPARVTLAQERRQQRCGAD